MLYLFHMAWQVSRALGAAVLCLSLPCCFSFIKLKYAYFTHWIALCRFSSVLLSEGENWLDMQEAPFQARKIKLGNQDCLKALCSAQKNKMQKNNLICKLISALPKHTELGAQKPAIRAGEGLVKLFLLSPWAWNTDFAGRLIQLQGHGLLPTGICPWRSLMTNPFYTGNNQLTVFCISFVEFKNWKRKASAAKQTCKDLSCPEDCDSGTGFITCWCDPGRKTTVSFWTESDNILLNMDREKIFLK